MCPKVRASQQLKGSQNPDPQSYSASANRSAFRHDVLRQGLSSLTTSDKREMGPEGLGYGCLSPAHWEILSLLPFLPFSLA